MNNRKNDLLDVINIEFQDNVYGFNSRVSFLQLGLYYQDKENNNYGIRNGMIGNLDHQHFSLLFLGSEEFNGKKIKINKEYEEKIEEIQKSKNIKDITKDLEKYYLKKQSIQEENINQAKRNKYYTVYFPFGITKPHKKTNSLLKEKENFSKAHVYTDIQMQIGLYYGITFGINLGEFIDFLTGIFYFDLLNDDIQ